ncbi:MAG: transcription termination/antitermination protein NusG [Halanaerobiaceae bacterium]
MGEKTQWYIVHTYSGHEMKVKDNLEKRVASTGMEDKIKTILVPTEEKIKKNDGEEEIVDETLFPGYVLIEMEMNDDTWYVVRNTPGVAGFVSSGTKPLPAQQEEIDRIMADMDVEGKKSYDVEFEKGDNVSVIDGPFEDFVGVVQEVHPQQGKVKVVVSMFGRDTPVELDFAQVEPE